MTADQEKVVSLSVTWESGTVEPKPLRINIDGQGFQCKTGPEPDIGNVDLTGPPDNSLEESASSSVAPPGLPNTIAVLFCLFLVKKIIDLPG